MDKPTIFSGQFEGRHFTAYVFQGRPCVIAAGAGRAIDYADDGKVLPDVIRKHWSDEMEEGKDFAVLTGAALHDFKAILDVIDAASVSRAPNLMVLYESGLYLVCLKTEKPLGKKLRRYLADEVLPALRRGELPGESPAMLHERRLMDREERLQRQQKSRALRRWAKLLREGKLAGDDVVLAYENEAASIDVGRLLFEAKAGRSLS
jgi:prophage antirepressor-like protein